MIGMPEIDYLVFKDMERRDLVQCCLVCKKWYRGVMPFIWRRIPTSTWWNLFHRLIVQDYFQSKCNEQQEQEQNPLRYGPYVRDVDLSELWYGLHEAREDRKMLHLKGIPPDPSTLEVFQHFLKRCPNIRDNFIITATDPHHIDHGGHPYDVAIAIIPYLRQAVIASRSGGRALMTFPTLKRIFSAASADLLESLELILNIQDSTDFDATSESPIPGVPPPSPHPVVTARPKNLIFRIMVNCDIETKDWSWFWFACCQVKELELYRSTPKFLEPLAVGIRDSMPCLDTLKIYLYDDEVDNDEYDKRYGQIVEACSQRLRSLELDGYISIGPHMRKGLLKHAATLEQLRVDHAGGSTELVDVLRACSSLKGLKMGSAGMSGNTMDAVAFSDRDPISGKLTPWLCRPTLETLQVLWDGIPRWSPQEDPSIRSQSEVIQRNLCERIGQFTNLRELDMHYIFHGPTDENIHLAVTLGTGLEKLSELKRLKKAHFYHRHGIDVPEVQWMMKHWKQVSDIDGLRLDSPADQWLQKHISHAQKVTEAEEVKKTSSLNSMKFMKFMKKNKK